MMQADLIAEARAGSEEAFEALWNQARPQLVRYGGSLRMNAEDLEDLLQDTAIKAWRAISKFDGRSSFTTWAQTIFRNRLFEIHRKRRVRGGEHESLSSRALEVVVEGLTALPDETLSTLIRDEMYGVAVSSLRPKEMEMVSLHYEHDLTYEQIERMTGQNRVTCRVRVMRAVGKMRRRCVTGRRMTA